MWALGNIRHRASVRDRHAQLTNPAGQYALDVVLPWKSDGLGLAARVAAGDVFAADLLQLARARADKLNSRINAICLRLDDRAERQVAGPLSGPFAGVPFLLKDLHQDIAGVRSGSDALCVRACWNSTYGPRAVKLDTTAASPSGAVNAVASASSWL